MATAYDIFNLVPTGNLVGVQFAVYNPEEIKKLSVLEITNTVNFNELGHPTPGGLYDPRLGPNDRDELCKTCGQTSMHCTGHLAHITLPLIVFNPLFIRVAFQLVNGTCFSCRQFRSNKVSCLLAAAQLRALEYGLVETAQSMEEAVFEVMSGSSDDDGSNASDLLVKSKLDELLNTALEGLDLKVAKREALVKNVVDFRRTLIKQFTQNHIAKAPRTCTNCRTQKRNMFLEFNSRIVVGGQPMKKTKAEKIKIERTGFEEPEEIAVEEGKEEDEQSNDNDPLEISSGQTYLTPKQAKEHLTKVYQNEKALISQLYAPAIGTDNSSTSPIDGFFIEVLPIAPSRFRPLSFMKDQKFENPQSASLTKLVQESYVIKNLLYAIQTGTEDFMKSIASIVTKIPGETLVEKLQVAWNNLQRLVNTVFDSDMDRLKSEKFPGVKQLLEKKEGLFRMHMMGKRVNYAARSVISPDPYIDVDEIGVPTVFATKLTYPEVVNQFTADSLKQAVLNGPDVHPGATMVKTEEGYTVFLGRDKVQRQRIANKLFSGTKEDILSGSKIVYRHLIDGDVMLLNRQPTLHKPSIMAHKARVLKGEKTLRLNYSNCKTYNADFDGDEMNAHFPQSEAARSEAYMIANVENQYLVPKDGTPLGGLIQDHIIGAVKLMTRGQFFSRDDYHQLIYSAISKKKGPIHLLPPAILKPCALWSGKQVVSTVLINAIPKDRNYINLTGTSKIAAKCWQRSPPQKWKAGGTPLVGNEMSENEVIVRNGELLCGILDKSHCGPTQYGLIHCCYELYGGKVATLLLSQLERLFTYYLQSHGFSLGVEDILVMAEADKKRREVMHNSRELGDEGIRSALKIPDSADDETVRDHLIMAHLSRDDKAMKDIDNAMKSKTDSITNTINKLCMPDGLLKKFPDNNLQLMVLSGAKGSTVNCMQISCLLGQIELEGRRPPLMLSGRSLPSFLPYSTTARAGGFVDGRFLTGIKLQEYFFHCMAGREGLIDTAVKTSRSGYLQRCLIKHLEGVMVAYDMTVRDSDGSVIQFQYGEDGLDIPKLPFLKPNQLSFLVDNFKSVRNDKVIPLLKEDELFADVLRHSKKVRKWLLKGGNDRSSRSGGFLKFCQKQEQLPKNDLVDMWFELDPAERAKYNRKSSRHFDPVSSVYRSDRHFGAVSEKLDSIIESYLSSRLTTLSADAFREMMYYKIQTSICQPGEAVGLLAAQSIGEPSTQMTLNTFHFAGRGEMNVTLGIPRLREILMTASAKISTPSVEVPLLADDEEQIEKTGEFLKKRLSRIYLSDVIQKFTVHERLNFNSSYKDRTYVVRFNFLPHKAYRKRLNTRPTKVLRYMERVFIPGLITAIKTQLRVIANTTMLTNVVVRDKPGFSKEEDEVGVDVEDNDASVAKLEDNEDEESSGDEDVEEADATADRNRMRHQQDREYEELDEEEKQIRDQTNQSDIDEDDDDDEVKSKKQEKFGNSMETDESNMEADISMTETQVEMDDSAYKRIRSVMDINNWIFEYKFDVQKEQWCELTLKLDLSMPRLNISDMVEEQVKKAIVYHVLGIKKAFTVDQNNANGTCQRILKTEGINIKEMFNYENMVDLRRLYSNDIHAVAQTYGIEAAARVVVKEIQNVFMVYGIEVDPRHLLLVADYMTFDGYYKPFNRLGLENSPSPLQQMSFESTMHFLKMATLSGSPDMLKSPSSRLVVGRPVSCGTGCFSLVHPIKAVPASQSPLTSCQ